MYETKEVEQIVFGHIVDIAKMHRQYGKTLDELIEYLEQRLAELPK